MNSAFTINRAVRDIVVLKIMKSILIRNVMKSIGASGLKAYKDSLTKNTCI